MVFCCIFCYFFLKKSFFCKLRCFVTKSVLSRFTRFCVEKNLAQNCICGEKMTNMRYGPLSTSLLRSGKTTEEYCKCIYLHRQQRFATLYPCDSVGWLVVVSYQCSFEVCQLAPLSQFPDVKIMKLLASMARQIVDISTTVS